MPPIHIAGNVLIGAAFLAAGLLLSRGKKAGGQAAIALAAVIFVAHYILNSRPDLYFKLVRSSNLVFYTNFFPFAVLMALPAFWAFSCKRAQKVRVSFLAVALIALSMWEFKFFAIPPAETRGNYIDKNGICHQTSVDTCSAAAAVTLLNLYGVDTTEQSVVEAAVTKKGRGTRHLGLVRALTMLTAHRPEATVRLEYLPLSRLLRDNQPAIIRVGVPKTMPLPVHRELVRKYNWTPGFLHDVTFLGVDPNDRNFVLIGEPEFGLERWPVAHLEALFQGYAVYLDMPVESILV